MHLEGPTMLEGMWPHALSNIEAGHSIIMELKYKTYTTKSKYWRVGQNQNGEKLSSTTHPTLDNLE